MLYQACNVSVAFDLGVRLPLATAFIPNIFSKKCCSTFFPNLKLLPSDATNSSDIMR